MTYISLQQTTLCYNGVFCISTFLFYNKYTTTIIIFGLLFIPSTKLLDRGLATAFSTAHKPFSRPKAKRESSIGSTIWAGEKDIDFLKDRKKKIEREPALKEEFDKMVDAGKKMNR